SLGPLRDRRPRSARGPAAALCTRPGNLMLALASFTIVSCVLTIIVLMWPLLFTKSAEKEMDTEGLSAQGIAKLERDKKEKASQGGEKEWLSKGYRYLYLSLCVLVLAYNGMIVYGTVQMLGLESAKWGMTAAVMMVIPVQYVLGGFFSLQWLFGFFYKI